MTVVAGLGQVPGFWPVIPARRLFTLRRVPPQRGDETVTAFRDGQVTKRSNRRTAGFTEALQEIGYQHVDAGDLVVHSMDGFAGAIGVSDSAGKMSPVANIYHVKGDARFFAYALRGLAHSGHIQSLAKGIRERSSSFDHVTVVGLDLPAPPVQEQQRIANFLDDRVARIHQVIDARQAQRKLVLKASESQTSGLLQSLPSAGPPLSAVARIVDTEHKTAPSVPGGGFWIAGTGAVRQGSLLHGRLRETDADSFAEWTARGAPIAGDVLLTREAPVGEVALLSADDPPVAIGQRVVLLKPSTGQLDSRFLRLILMAGEMRRVIALASAGSLHPHLNMSDISRLRIPNTTLLEQGTLGVRHSDILRETARLVAMLDRAVNLMNEYKQSLITAAVTGELDVTTTGSGIPG